MIKQIPVVDTWKPTKEQIIFTHAKNIILAPLDKYYHIDDSQVDKINYFMINPKKSYNSTDLRNHYCLYLNYFENYFDEDKEYFTNLAHIKFMIDCYPEYNMNNFMFDLNRYILQDSLYFKVKNMVEYNYSLELNYKSANNPQLQYDNEHGKMLMTMSIMMNLCIPLITHFSYMRRIQEIDEFILDVADNILYAKLFIGNADIASKFYQTAFSNIDKNAKSNAAIWSSTKQDIRGKDVVTHSISAVENIIINIMPKYTFDKNMVSLDYTSIRKANKFQITDIAYEYSYIPLSSSKRDGEDNTSDMDKHEANLIKTNEALYLQAKINYEFTVEKIEKMWGLFDDELVNFYMRSLRNENNEIINGFQRQLIFNLFYKYFGDIDSIKGINHIDYIKLMLSAKIMLSNNMMRYLPAIIAGKVEKIVLRKTLNKREWNYMINSQYYPLVVDKYKNEKIIKQILGTIATIITSTFSIIDYDNKDLHGKLIVIEPNIVIEECLLYALLI